MATGLSAVRNEATAHWWDRAAEEEEQARAPRFLLPMLRGETKRVRATREQIDEALIWAATLSGWEHVDGPKPLFVYDPTRQPTWTPSNYA